MTFGENELTKMITLEIADDAIFEDPEEVLIKMEFVDPTAAGHRFGQVSKAVLNILDNDEPGKSIISSGITEFV